MTAVGIIPARYASKRFPGKALAKIAGVPMIERVWRAACRAKHLRTAIVATDDDRIAEACRGFGAPVALTSPDHETGTDRLAEVAGDLADDVVVNIQGDEPLIEGFVIDAVVEALLAAEHTPMATAVHEADPGALEDPNRVKVVLDQRGFALYFSRSAIPALRDREAHRAARGVHWQHVGLYAYRRPFLLELVALPPTPAERCEQLEQLRALEHGHRIRVAQIQGWRSAPVDVPADIAAVERQLAARPHA